MHLAWLFNVIQSMRLAGERSWVYDKCYGVDRLSAIGDCVKRCMHSGVCGAVLRFDKATYVYLPLILCAKENLYARRLAAIDGGNLSLTDDALDIHSLQYVSFTDPYNTLHFLSYFEYWLEDIAFQQRICVQKRSTSFDNWYFVDIFGILTGQREELSVQVPSLLSSYKVSRLLFVPTAIVIAYPFSLALLKERRSLFFSLLLPISFYMLLCRYFVSFAW